MNEFVEHRPTLEDVAKAAGLSVATLDRVINKRPGVRAATIKRAEDALEKLGYRTNLAATSLAKNAPVLVGILVDEGAMGLCSYLSMAIQTQAFNQTGVPVDAKIYKVDRHGNVADSVWHDKVDVLISYSSSVKAWPERTRMLDVAGLLSGKQSETDAMATRLAANIGEVLAHHLKPMQKRFEMRVGVVMDQAPTGFDRAILRGFIETMGPRLRDFKSAVRLEQLVGYDIVLLIGANKPKTETASRDSEDNRLIISTSLSNTDLLSLAVGEIDGIVAFEPLAFIGHALTTQTRPQNTEFGTLGHRPTILWSDHWSELFHQTRTAHQ